MFKLQENIELQKVLDTIKEIEPDFKVPELYMFNFDSCCRRRTAYGLAYSSGEIRLSLRDIGDFNCKNEQFIKTIVHEVIHINYWELKHNEKFKEINNELFLKVFNKLNVN